MKIKFDKFSFEMTDKDYQNILNGFKYLNGLPGKDQAKMIFMLIGVPLIISEMGLRVFKTVKEENRKDKLLDTKCEIDIKTLEKKKELMEE